MIGIHFPLTIENGDLKLDFFPEDIFLSEVRAILTTRPGERVYRNNYGAKNQLLKKLDLNQLIADYSLALETNLEPLGFREIVVDVDSSIAELQQGIVNLIIRFSIESEEITTSFVLEIS